MKKILLVADQPGWIFERHCQEIKKRLSNEYEIGIAFHRQDIPEISKNYDLVYVLDPMPMKYPPAHKTIMGLRCEFLYEEHPRGAKALYEEGYPGRCVSLNKCKILHMVNRHQMNVFKDIVTDKPLVLAQHGVDETLFDRNKYKKKKNDILTIGVSGRNSNNKGFNLVSKVCQEEGCKIISASYGHQKLTKEQMPEFYTNVDVHVCFSKSEGLSNPIMEAGAMGIPVVSTNVGASGEMIRDGISGLLINRDVESLRTALRTLKDPDLRHSMGEEFYKEIIKNWTWKVRIDDFRKMFNMFFEGLT